MSLQSNYIEGDTIKIHDHIDDYKGRLVGLHGDIFTVINVSRKFTTVKGLDDKELKITNETIDIFSNVFMFIGDINNLVKVPVIEKI